MKKTATLLLLTTLALAACNEQDKQTSEPAPVEAVEAANDYAVRISNVATNLRAENNWHTVPNGVESMTITVEAERVDAVLFWLAPTGTETGLERELIGYDLDGSDGWSIDWSFGDRTFHNHLTIQALGSDFATQANETLNIRSEDTAQ